MFELKRCAQQRERSPRDRVRCFRKRALAGAPASALATQAERYVALHFLHGKQLLIGSIQGDCSIDQIKWFSILINVDYVHNRNWKKERQILDERSLSFSWSIFIQMRVWSRTHLWRRVGSSFARDWRWPSCNILVPDNTPISPNNFSSRFFF